VEEQEDGEDFDALKILENQSHRPRAAILWWQRLLSMLMWQSLSMKPESKQVNAATAGGSERHKTARDCTAGRCRLRGTFAVNASKNCSRLESALKIHLTAIER